MRYNRLFLVEPLSGSSWTGLVMKDGGGLDENRRGGSDLSQMEIGSGREDHEI